VLGWWRSARSDVVLCKERLPYVGVAVVAQKASRRREERGHETGSRSASRARRSNPFDQPG
jgi:hypothetical protein